jgi:hypothetical protein
MATRSSPICFWRSPPARTRARPASTTGARRRTGSRCRRRPGLQEQENGPRQQVSGVPFWLMPPSPGARRIRLPERARPMALLCRSRPPFAIHEGPPRRVSVLENPRSGGCPMALMASCRRQARAAAAGWARRIAGAISVAWPLLRPRPGPGERPDAAQQASEQIVGTVNATNVSSLVARLRAAAAVGLSGKQEQENGRREQGWACVSDSC